MDHNELAPPSRLDKVRAFVCWMGAVGFAAEALAMAPDPDVSVETILAGLVVSSAAIVQGIGPVMRIRSEAERSTVQN